MWIYVANVKNIPFSSETEVKAGAPFITPTKYFLLHVFHRGFKREKWRASVYVYIKGTNSIQYLSPHGQEFCSLIF